MDSEPPALSTLFWQGAQPVIKIYVCYLTGAWLARAGVLTENANRVLVKCLSHLFYPCLLLTRNMQGMSAEVFWEFATALAFILIFLGVGYGMGEMVVRVIPGGKLRWARTLVAAMTWANIGDLPFTFFLSYGDIPPFKRGDMALGMAIVTLMGGPYNFTVFSLFGPRTIGKDWAEPGEAGEEKEEEMEHNIIHEFGGMQSMDSESLQTAEGGLGQAMTEGESRRLSHTSDIARRQERAIASQGSFPSQDSTTIATLPTATTAQRHTSYPGSTVSSKRKKQTIPHRLWRFFVRAWTPMNGCLVLGIIIGLSPPLRRLFAQDNPPEGTAPLEWLEVDLALLGAISLPLSCVNMGAVCTRGSLRDIPRIPTLAFLIIRLLCFPALAMGLGYAACAMGWIGWDDHVLRLYIILIACAPPTMPCLLTIQALASGTGADQQVTSMTAFLYVVSFFTSITYIFIMLYLMTYR